MMFLKLQNDKVIIKGRGCVYRMKQTDCISKEDTSSPTVSTKGLMLFLIIDAMAGCEVTTSDIPGSFLQTNYDRADIRINRRGDGNPT